MGASPLQTYSALSASLKENSSLDSVTRSPRHIRSHAVRGEDLRVGRGHRVSGPSSFLSRISSPSWEAPDSDPSPHSWGQKCRRRETNTAPDTPTVTRQAQPLWSSESQVLLLFLGLCSCLALRPDILPRLQVVTGPTPTAEASAHLSSSLGAPSQPRPLNLLPAAISVTLLLPEPSRCQTSSCLLPCLPLFPLSLPAQSSPTSQCSINNSCEHKRMKGPLRWWQPEVGWGATDSSLGELRFLRVS